MGRIRSEQRRKEMGKNEVVRDAAKAANLDLRVNVKVCVPETVKTRAGRKDTIKKCH